MTTIDPRVQELHRLHESGCFVIPNPYDAGTAKLLEQLGFSALATSSAGFAWTTGRPDNGVTLDEALAHYTAVAAAVRIPVSADFERAYATEPEEVAANVTRACATGLAGLSVEDWLAGQTRHHREPEDMIEQRREGGTIIRIAKR